MTGRIDVHHHVVPPDYAALLREKGIRPGGIPLPTWAMPAAAKVMTANGVSTAILSVSTPGVWFGDVPEARLWARRVNEHAAEIVEGQPERFGFFATLTLPDVEGAIAEAEHALDVLRADGVVLLANNAGLYLGDPAFDRLLAFLDERGAVVFVHPGELPAEPVPGIPTFTADFLLDTTRAATNLILSGALERYTRINWILAHAGGFVPYIAHRMVLTRVRELPRWRLAGMALRRKQAVARQMAVFERFHYDVALSSTSETFPTLMRVAGPDRLLFGSDYPFAPAAAVRYMAAEYDEVNLPGRVRRKVDRGNAERLFPRLAAAG